MGASEYMTGPRDLLPGIGWGEEIDLCPMLEQLGQVMSAPDGAVPAELPVSQTSAPAEPGFGGDEICFHLGSHDALAILYGDAPSASNL